MTNGKKVLIETLKSWSPIAVTIIVLALTAYMLAQQNYRMLANEQPIQIAEDISEAISQGTPPNTIVPPTGNTDISKSLGVFVMIYDDKKTIIGSSAALDGKNPTFPAGVMDNAKNKGQQRVTWQPKSGVRIASVTQYFTSADGKTSGYIIAGRSLREVEKNEMQSLKLAGFGALFALIITFLLCWLYKKMETPKIEAVVVEEIIVQN